MWIDSTLKWPDDISGSLSILLVLQCFLTPLGSSLQSCPALLTRTRRDGWWASSLYLFSLTLKSLPLWAERGGLCEWPIIMRKRMKVTSQKLLWPKMNAPRCQVFWQRWWLNHFCCVLLGKATHCAWFCHVSKMALQISKDRVKKFALFRFERCLGRWMPRRWSWWRGRRGTSWNCRAWWRCFLLFLLSTKVQCSVWYILSGANQAAAVWYCSVKSCRPSLDFSSLHPGI